MSTDSYFPHISYVCFATLQGVENATQHSSWEINGKALLRLEDHESYLALWMLFMEVEKAGICLPNE